MNSILVVLVACLAYASAINLELSEERTFSNLIQSTDGHTYLGLNATYIWSVVGVATFFFVVMLVMAGGILTVTAQKTQRHSQEFSKEIFLDAEREGVQYRYKRSIADNGKDTFNIEYNMFKGF